MDEKELRGKKARSGKNSPFLKYAWRQFLLIFLFGVFINILFLTFFPLFHSPHPFISSVLETAAVVLLVLPFYYFYYLRPLGISLAARATDVTGRLTAENALRESNELVTLFLRNSPIFAYIKEVAPGVSRFLQASENFYEMTGLPGSLMVGKRMEELFSVVKAAQMTADDWAVVSEGRELRLDEELNGRMYTTIKFPIMQGGKRLLAGYSIDVTERMEIEKALKESEQKYKMLHESAGLGIAYYSTDATVISFNRVAASSMNGQTGGFQREGRWRDLPERNIRALSEENQEGGSGRHAHDLRGFHHAGIGKPGFPEHVHQDPGRRQHRFRGPGDLPGHHGAERSRRGPARVGAAH